MVATVGLLGPIGQNGGVASHLEGLQAEFLKRGLQVESVGEIGAQLLAPFHPFQFIPQYLVAMRRLRNVDLLHSHDARLVTLKKRLRKPIVTTFHGYLPEETRMRGASPIVIDFCEAFVQACVEKSDAIIAVDNRIAHWLRKRYGASGIHVIPNGVDPELFHPMSGYEVAIEVDSYGESGRLQGRGGAKVSQNSGENFEEHPLILFAKGLSPKNGVSILIEAMSLVRREYPEADLFMATGQVPHAQMPDLIRQSDIVIIPSVPVAGVEEATSILALEAMASGKCVIASNIGGLREIIQHDKTGILVPPSDPEALATEIIEALRDEGRRDSLGRNARAHVLAHYTWEMAAERTMRVYENVLSEAG